ncbi:hypothetical protein [Tunturiibacter lichenicola]|uniref:hypothetical protein n=1 Tax=Tunturiibacter lichenicola TaxID=2051959 RepID=UPI003D9AFF0D
MANVVFWCHVFVVWKMRHVFWIYFSGALLLVDGDKRQMRERTTTTADPYGMTTKRTDNSNSTATTTATTTTTATATADPYGMTTKGQTKATTEGGV